MRNYAPLCGDVRAMLFGAGRCNMMRSGARWCKVVLVVRGGAGRCEFVRCSSANPATA